MLKLVRVQMESLRQRQNNVRQRVMTMVKTNIDWYGVQITEDELLQVLDLLWNYTKQKVDAFIKMMRRVYDALKTVITKVQDAIQTLSQYYQKSMQTDTRLFYCYCESRCPKVNTNPYWCNTRRMYHIRDRC